MSREILWSTVSKRIKECQRRMVKIAQTDAFHREAKSLRQGKAVSSHSKLITLSPFLGKRDHQRWWTVATIAPTHQPMSSSNFPKKAYSDRTHFHRVSYYKNICMPVPKTS